MNRYFKNLDIAILALILFVFIFNGCATKELLFPNYQKIVTRAGFYKDTTFLIKILEHRNATVRKDAVIFLGEIKDIHAVVPLIKLLNDKDPNVRRETVKALGIIKDPRAIKPLIAKVKDKDANVRRETAKAFGLIKDRRAIKPLIYILNDSDLNVQKEAIVALGQINDSLAVEPLIVKLKNRNEDIQKEAINVLGKIKNSRAVKPLVLMLINENSDIRAMASRALWQIDLTWWNREVTKEAVPILIEGLNSQDLGIRKEAIITLGEIKDIRAIEPLIVSFTDKNEDNRVEAINSIVKIGAPAVTPLIFHLQDKNLQIRKSSAEALGKIKDSRAVDPLMVMVKRKELGIYREAISAILEIGVIERLVPILKDIDYSMDDKAFIIDALIKAKCDIETLPYFDEFKILLSSPKVNFTIEPKQTMQLYLYDKVSPYTGKTKILQLQSGGPRYEIDSSKMESVFNELQKSPLVFKSFTAFLCIPRFIQILSMEYDPDFSWENVQQESANIRKQYAVKVLKEITNNDFGEDYVAWKKWWERNKANYR